MIPPVASVHLDNPGLHPRSWLLGVDLEVHALAGLEAEKDPVWRHIFQRRFAEQLLRRMPQPDRDQR